MFVIFTQNWTNLPVDAIGLDFVEGKETATLVATGFPADKTLYAGIVNGKNIWRNHYEKELGYSGCYSS